jgi:hypothetical protein
LNKFDDKFKKHYLFELNRLLDTINFELFGYDGRTFQKNAWYENTIGDKILFTRDDLITIKKIVGIIPIVIERDASVSQEDDVAQYIHRYMDNEIYYHKNNWYYKTKDHDRVKNRIIKSQYYFYGSSYKHNQYALNYFKYISKSETKGNLDSELVFKLIKSLIYLEYLNPAPNDKYESKSNKDTLRRIDELIALTGYRYRRKDNKRVPFGIPVKTLEEFSWLFQDYCMHREGTKRTTTKLPPSEMVELDKKVFAIVILFQSKDYRTFVDLM